MDHDDKIYTHLARIEAKQDRVQDKLEEHAVRLARLDITMVRNTDSLEEHMVRSDNLETQVKVLYRFKYYVVGALIATSIFVPEIRGLFLSLFP